MTDFKNHRAQNPRYLKPPKNGLKKEEGKPNCTDVNTGNRKPETGSKINESGPAEI